jgi:hypothetical protein
MSGMIKQFIKSVLQEKLVFTQDMKCPKCKTKTHADDQMHTSYYECPKCHYRWELREDIIRKSFGEPLTESQLDSTHDPKYGGSKSVYANVESRQDEYLVRIHKPNHEIIERFFHITDTDAMNDFMIENGVTVVGFMTDPLMSFDEWLNMNEPF